MKSPVSIDTARRGAGSPLNRRPAVLHNESCEDFHALLDEFLNQYQPSTPGALNLVHDLVNSTWRLNRILTLETAGIDYEVDLCRENPQTKTLDEASVTHLAVCSLTANTRALAWYSRHESRLRRAIRDARAQLEKCRIEPGNGQLPTAA